MNWVYDDGGRNSAGFWGRAGDCVTRSIAIAPRPPYRHVYALLNEQAQRELPTGGRRSSARNGVFRQTCQEVLEALGWRWVPTMKIGCGCRVDFKAAELPRGRLIARSSKEMMTVIDGTFTTLTILRGAGNAACTATSPRRLALRICNKSQVNKN